ncbi:MAG: T9SS type A sorting domain-containing protein, partial [Bacteroidota bacterium]
TLYIPDNTIRAQFLFTSIGKQSDIVCLDNIDVEFYKNASAYSDGSIIYVDKINNLSSTFLRNKISKNQIFGLPVNINVEYRTPVVPVSCPINAIIEGEPDCVNEYVDSIDGGCNTTPPVFKQLYGCNGIVCGKSGTFTSNLIPNRDYDCYQLVLNGPTNITIKVVADFTVKLQALSITSGCDVILPIGGPINANSGDTAIININITSATILDIWIAPNTVFGIPCGSNYVMIYKTTPVTTPATPVPAANPACTSTQLNAVTNSSNYSYYWQGSSCGTNTANPASLSYPVNSTGTYFVRGIYTPLGCWTPCSSVNVTINNPPIIIANANPSTVCSGSQSVLTATGATSYTWMPGSLSGSPLNVNPSSTTIYTVTGNLSGCTSTSTVTVSTNPFPSAAGTITGTSSLCAGINGVAYNVSTIADASSYVWTYSGTGATINGTGNAVTINFAYNATSGTLTVKGNNTCGFGAVSTGFTITVKPLPNVSASALPSTVCSGATSALTGLGNATVYTWQPGSLSGSPVNVSPALTTIYTVTGDLNGCTSSSTVTVSTNPFPASAGAISGTSSLCAGVNGIAYNVGTIADASSYVWAYSGTGASINGTGNAVTINFANNATSGTLTVKGNNSCGFGTISAGFSITVKPLPNVSASALPSTVCSGTTSTLTGSGDATVYAWQPGSLSGSPVNVSPILTTVYTLTGNLNGCTSTSTVSVNTNPFPSAAGSIIGTSSVCEGTNGISYNVAPIADALSYIWAYSGTGASNGGSGNSITIDFALGATSGILTVKGNNNCGDGTISSGYPITVKPLPIVSATGVPSYICEGQATVLTASGNATSYVWQPGNLSGSPQNVYPSASTVFTLTGSLLGCTDTSSVVITVDPCTGISENDQSGDIKVGPVPVHDQLKIECNSESDLTVSLFTVEGKLLSVQQYVGDRTYYFSTSYLSASVYFLRIRSDNETRTFKIVKE